MIANTSETAFESFVKEHGQAVEALAPQAGIQLMLEFYREVRAEGVAALDAGGDMLLFQWGTYDWGKGEHFEIELCRQFRDSLSQDDDAISQLRLTFYFTPTENLVQLKHGERWCDQPKWLSEFDSFIRENQAFQTVASTKPEAVELLHHQV